jgi:hypothetical protein
MSHERLAIVDPAWKAALLSEDGKLILREKG